MTRRAALLAVAAFAMAASPAVAAPHNASQTGLRTISLDKVPPDFTFDVGTGPERLSSLFGKPIVLNFWATWCKPCLTELGVFSQMESLYGTGVTLITLSNEAPGTARAVLNSMDLTFPLVEDPSGAIFRAYSVRKVPVTIVLGRDGAVVHVSVGELDWNELHTALEAALSQA